MTDDSIKAERPTSSRMKSARPNEKIRTRTRNKLMASARLVMGRQGIDATAINDITAEAGVAFGSFYNYFTSKEELARAVFVEDALALADMLDRVTPPDADIAEAVASNIGKTLQHGLSDPIWGWFMVHMAHSVNDLVRETLGLRLVRDLTKGKSAGRFVITNIDSTVDCIIGGCIYFLRQILEGHRDPTSVTSLVEFLLCGLGLDQQDAARVAKINC